MKVHPKKALTDGYGQMNRCKREAVIRFRRYNKDTESSNWQRANLVLYFPWYNEQYDLLDSYSTYEEHYNHVYIELCLTMKTNIAKQMLTM